MENKPYFPFSSTNKQIKDKNNLELMKMIQYEKYKDTPKKFETEIIRENKLKEANQRLKELEKENNRLKNRIKEVKKENKNIQSENL